MANMTAVFRLVDEMSSRLDNIANSGNAAIDRWEKAGTMTDETLGKATHSAVQTAHSIETATDAIDNYEQTAITALDKTSNSAEKAIRSVDGVAQSAIVAKTHISNSSGELEKNAEKMEKAALNAELLADKNKRLAERAREYYEKIKSTTDAEGNYTEALNKKAQAALLEADRLEKAAKASQVKAEKARDAAQSARDNADEHRNSAQAADEFSDSLNNASNILDKHRGEIENAVSSARSFREGISKQEEALDKLHEAYTGLLLTENRKTETAKALKKEINTLSDSITDNKREFEAAENAAGKFSDTGVNAVQELSKALAAAGVIAALYKIYEGFTYCVTKAIEFESAITGVYKTVDGSGEQLQKISEDIRNMSVVMPAGAAEIAGVAESAGQLGIAVEDITAFTEVMINLGETTNLSADEAASALAKFTNITGMDAGEYENLGSAIVALGNNFATTEADIVAMSTRMASAGTMAGFTEPEILALAASMSEVGIEAEAGGSAMSKLISGIQVAVETGSEKLDEFASVAGMTGEQFADVFGNQATDALIQFISGLNDVERNGASATVILDEMGITEVNLSNAIKSLANNSEGLSGAISVANTAWSKNTALANEAGLRYQTLESRIAMTENAADNLAAAFGENLTPAVGFFVDAGRGALEWFTGVIEDCPMVSAVITSVTASVGLFAVAVTAFALVTTPIIKTAIDSITAAMMANPIFLTITAVAAITAGVIAFASVLKSQEAEYETWTASTKNQYDELQRLNEEYDKAIEQQSETTDKAKELRYEIDILTEEFESNKKTVEQFTAEIDKLAEEQDKLMEKYRQGIADANDYEQGNLALINRLEQLATQSYVTKAAQEEIQTILDKLNETIPNLALNYDELMQSVNGNVEAMEGLAKAEAEQRKEQTTINSYLDAFKRKEELANAVTEAMENVRLEQERLDNASFFSNDWIYNHTGQGWLGSWVTDMDEYKSALEEAQAAVQENNVLIKAGKEIYEKRAKEAEEAAKAITSYEDAVSISLNSVQSELNELIVSYDNAFETARQSIDGQIGLFDKMKTETELSVQDMTQAMQSQVEYLNLYNENLQKAVELGFDDRLIASLSDGSTESAGQLDAIINEVERLGETTYASTEFIKSFNDQFYEAENAKDKFSATVAEMETDFATKMDEIESKLAESIEGMNMEAGAEEAAMKTLAAYTEAIRAGGENAVEEAENAARKVAVALGMATDFKFPTYGATAENNYESGAMTDELNGYATGTASATPGLALVGERGPELVNFSGGEVVYTAPETERIINSLGNQQLDTVVPENISSNFFYNDATTESRSGDKRIILDIDISNSGSTGNFKHRETGMEKSTDSETVWGIVAPRLKEAFIGILKQEIFEEGELAYDY